MPTKEQFAKDWHMKLPDGKVECLYTWDCCDFCPFLEKRPNNPFYCPIEAERLDVRTDNFSITINASRSTITRIINSSKCAYRMNQEPIPSDVEKAWDDMKKAIDSPH